MKVKIKNRSKFKKIATIIVFIIVFALLLLALYSSNTWPFRKDNETSQSQKEITNTEQDTVKGIANPEDVKTDDKDTSKDPDDNTGTKIDTDLNPAKPTGTFVSNHSPSLTEEGLNKISSTCITSPGVICTIEISKDGNIKKLPEKKTNSNGATSWSWTLQDLNLTTGEWTVTAMAINGDRISSSQDPIPMEVRK